MTFKYGALLIFALLFLSSCSAPSAEEVLEEIYIPQSYHVIESEGGGKHSTNIQMVFSTVFYEEINAFWGNFYTNYFYNDPPTTTFGSRSFLKQKRLCLF